MIAEMSPNQVNSDRFYLSLGNPHPPGIHLDPAVANVDILGESMARFVELVDDLKQYPSLRYARVLPQLHYWLWGNERGR
jgi:hypothetical protein